MRAKQIGAVSKLSISIVGKYSFSCIRIINTRAISADYNSTYALTIIIVPTIDEWVFFVGRAHLISTNFDNIITSIGIGMCSCYICR